MSVRKTIAHNTAYNAAGRVWEALVGIGLTIYIIDRVGLEGFGLWSLVAVFTGYAALFDFGVSSAFTKYIASYAARDDHDRVSAVVSTGAAFYGLLGALLLIVGWPLIDRALDGVLALMAALFPDRTWSLDGSSQWADARFLFRGALLLFVVTNVLAPLAALQSGLQRMGITNALSAAASLLKVIATVYFLEQGFGVRGLLYTNGIVLAAFGVANIVVARRIYPNLRFGPRFVTWAVFRTLLSFGWRSQVAKLSNLINFQTDRLLIAIITGGQLDLVGLYRVGEDLASKVRQIPALLVSALVPAVSDLDSREDHERVAQLYLRSTKYVAALTVPLTVFVLGASDMLVALYGPKESLSTAGWVASILMLGYAMNLLPGPGVSVALGKGNASLPMMAGLISTVGNIVLTILLYQLVGFYGIPAATSLALAVSTLWFFRAIRHEVPVSPGQLVRESLLWPVLACLPGMLGCLAVRMALQTYEDRIGNVVVAGLLAGGFGLLYVLCLRWTPFIDRYDVHFLRDTLRLGRVPGFHFLTARVHHG
jgi:O-antigen/teichoic acid export membrane protein